MKPLGLFLTTLMIAVAGVSAASAKTAVPEFCGSSTTVLGVSCAQARLVMSAWMNSYDGSSPARFRYGPRTWSCGDDGKPRGGQQLWRCVSKRVSFRSWWPLNYNQRNATCQQPTLSDNFDGNTSTSLSVVDFEHTPGVGCDYASQLFTSLYGDGVMPAANGVNSWRLGAYSWRCSTDGAAGVAGDNWWSDVSLNCTSLPTSLTSLQQWLAFDVGTLPVVACTGSSTLGPASNCPDYTENVLDDSDLPSSEGYQSAGMQLESFNNCQPGGGGCSSGNMLVPIVGATDHYALCIWRDAGPVDAGGVSEEGYTCTFGGSVLPATS
jgi:hypothetical protein